MAAQPVWAQSHNIFFSVLRDVPITPGLQESEDSSLVFDKPEGRIVQVQAIIPPQTTQAQILDFYAVALTNFGWARSSQRSFTRKGEILDFDFMLKNEQPILRLYLRPD